MMSSFYCVFLCKRAANVNQNEKRFKSIMYSATEVNKILGLKHTGTLIKQRFNPQYCLHTRGDRFPSVHTSFKTFYNRMLARSRTESRWRKVGILNQSADLIKDGRGRFKQHSSRTN